MSNNRMKWSAQAPANIALIKYMGKTDHQANAPSNASLSYTLNNLQSFVTLELIDAAQDQWQPLAQPDCQPITLDQKAQQRFLNHFQFLKQHFNYSGVFLVQSANNFPANCGLASSASSFAALTRAAVLALTELTNSSLPDEITQAELSQQGSGSSCRSFFQPWALWEQTTVNTIELPYNDLIHQVIVTHDQQKAVSSSQAHRLVATSELFVNRPQRAAKRLTTLINCLHEQQWEQAYKIIWQEFWDMHALFETAAEPFGYMNAQSLAALNYLRQHWQQQHDGPLITMDAGPNIHLLYRSEQSQLATSIKQQLEGQHYHVL